MTTDRPDRILHTMIRVADPDKAIGFYCGGMGMNVLSKLHFADGKYSLIYLGFGTDASDYMLELTHNWDRAEPYGHGDAYGHIAIGVEDLDGCCAAVEAHGGKVLRQPGPMAGSPFTIAFVEDPDGYKIELIRMPFDPIAAAANTQAA